VSFFGGGTDFREYYLQDGGCVLTSAIDKYIYVIIKERFDEKIRVGYTQTEMVDHVDELQHELVRECMRKTGILRQVEISTMADIPSAGSGLGSSSTVTVGLLNAMYTYQGIAKDQESLAREACEIEIDVLGKPIGVQDQYIAAYGGQRIFRFQTDGEISVERLAIPAATLRKLDDRLLLFYTNVARKAESVLDEQRANINDRRAILREMKGMVEQATQALQNQDLDRFGALLHEGWVFKQQLASKISNPAINEMYLAARQAGARGGKVTGAGGGGFLLLYCPPAAQDDVRYALAGLHELPFRLERDGTKVIFNVRR
jgi:D-glycero-alpha-D-manno-heptose-7-phosphate kinase